jgi:hypothetical protein
MPQPFAQLDLDLVGLVAAFDLYVLPPAVAAVVLYAIVRGRRSGVHDPLRDRERAVRWVGLLNYGLALRALLMVVPEVVDYARFGAFPSFPVVNVFWPLAMAVAHAVVGLGVRRLRPWGRWSELALNAIAVGFLLLAAARIWSFGESFDLAFWPELVAARVLPFFLLVVMLLPRTARVFSADYRASVAGRPPAPTPVVKPSPVTLMTLAFLVILGSVVAVNATDWMIRYGSVMMGPPGG